MISYFPQAIRSDFAQLSVTNSLTPDPVNLGIRGAAFDFQLLPSRPHRPSRDVAGGPAFTSKINLSRTPGVRLDLKCRPLDPTLKCAMLPSSVVLGAGDSSAEVTVYPLRRRAARLTRLPAHPEIEISAEVNGITRYLRQRF